MSQLPKLKRHAKPRRRVGLLSAAGGLQLAGAGGAGGIAPSLVMPEEEDRKSSIIAGFVTTLIHAAVVAALFLAAWLAPPLEEIIPVKIIREAPVAVPAPARKILKPRRQHRPVQQARKVTAQAVQQPRVMKMSAEQLKMNEVRKARAPQAVQRREVVSQRVQARSIDTRVFNSNVNLSNLDDVVVATDMNAPVVDYDGPREIDQGAAVMMPDNFAAVPEVDNVDYSSAAPFQIESAEPLPENLEAFEFDTNMGIYAGGEGTGGTGTAVDSVRCLESAAVNRYVGLVEVRTTKRWTVPDGSPGDVGVRLRFVLDASGTATEIEVKGKTNTALGNSAIAAMRAASPFPPMDDNVRCLAGRPLLVTFTNENL